MLRLPRFELRQPSTVDEAVDLLRTFGQRAMLVAGGTDLLPNMKHELATPEVLISLSGVRELRGIQLAPDGAITIGAMTTIADVATNDVVRSRLPALSQAAALIAGPQLRRMGTLGGNVMLDTRCQWYNQTYFWRSAIGFCLKKDGAACHVVAGGSRCVAAASSDSVPALMTLGAEVDVAGPGGQRRVSLNDFWSPDGRRHHRLEAGEILTGIRVPAPPAGHRGAYGKLRDRGAIDYPLLGIAVRLDVDSAGKALAADLVVTALAAAPRRIKAAAEWLPGGVLGSPEFADRVARVADAAYRQCHPLENIPGDRDYRREMVRVYVRRTIEAAAAGAGLVHRV